MGGGGCSKSHQLSLYQLKKIGGGLGGGGACVIIVVQQAKWSRGVSVSLTTGKVSGGGGGSEISVI